MNDISQNTTYSGTPAQTAQAVVMQRGQAGIRDIGAELRRAKMGAPSIRSQELMDEILERLVCGEALTSITHDPAMPAWVTVWNWRRADADFDSLVKRASEIGQHALMDVVQDIARGGRFSTGDVKRDKMLIDAIMSVAAKRNRSDFGDRLQIDQRTIQITMTKDDCDW